MASLGAWVWNVWFGFGMVVFGSVLRLRALAVSGEAVFAIQGQVFGLRASVGAAGLGG